MRALAATALVTLVVACGGHTASTSAPTPATRRAPPADPVVRYVAGTSRYRVESTSRFAQEVMGNSQEVTLGQLMLFTAALAPDSGNIALTATVESLTVSGGAPGIDASMLNAAVGQAFRSRFTAEGRPVSSSVPDSGNPAIVHVGRLFRDFLPHLPASTAAGTTWVDTVRDTQTMAGGAGQTVTQSVREYRVVGWETRDSVRALHISGTGHYTITGTGESQGQPIELTGAGQATSERWISAAGVYLGGTTSDSTDITINVINMGMTVPVHQTQQLIITRQR